MPTVLVTGANRGLGLEFARQYLADDWQVLACCRNPGKADQLRALDNGALEIFHLDVADSDQIRVLAGDLTGRPIDLLINNAGVGGPRMSEEDYGQPLPWLQVLRINLIAPFELTRALLGNLQVGKQKKIATVTSKMGSMGDNTGGGSVVYRSSKAGLNAVMKSLSIDLAEEGFIVLILHPGWVLTDMGGPDAWIGVEKSVSGMRAIIEHATPEHAGRFFAYDGAEIPW
jgi:NAD(P)-dependent dehydrogenase (short-subunit alcohol dehydrogenase family)